MIDKDFWVGLQPGEEIKLQGLDKVYGSTVVRGDKSWHIWTLKAEQIQEEQDLFSHVDSLVEGINSLLLLVGFKLVFSRAVNVDGTTNEVVQKYLNGTDCEYYPTWDDVESLDCLVYVVQVTVEAEDTIFNHISPGDEFVSGEERYLKLAWQRHGCPPTEFFACRLNGKDRGEILNPPPYDMRIRRVVKS